MEKRMENYLPQMEKQTEKRMENRLPDLMEKHLEKKWVSLRMIHMHMPMDI
jgi:hypothetical protein